MGPAYIPFQMFLYYPSLLLILYIYAVFIIPLRSRVFRNEYWFSIKDYFDRSDVRRFFTKRWGKGRKHE